MSLFANLYEASLLMQPRKGMRLRDLIVKRLKRAGWKPTKDDRPEKAISDLYYRSRSGEHYFSYSERGSSAYIKVVWSDGHPSKGRLDVDWGYSDRNDKSWILADVDKIIRKYT